MDDRLIDIIFILIHYLMKKILALTLGLFLIMGMWSCSSDDDDKVVPETELPAAAKTFLMSYFPEAKVLKVEKDTKHANAEYDVTLSNGFSVEFTQAGEWVDVDAPLGITVPDGIVPPAISAYIAEKYPDNGVNEISKEATHYEVELVTGLDLNFSLDGIFLGFGD